MYNALQLTDAGVAGIMQGLADVAERSRQQREYVKRRDMILEEEVGAWKQYSMALEGEISKQKFAISVLSKKYHDIAKDLADSRVEYRRYATKLAGCIMQIDNNFQRQSANAHALTGC